MRRAPSAIAAILSALVVCSTHVGARADGAAPIAPQAALERLFTSAHVDADWFAQSFLQQVSAAQVETIVGQLKAQLGAYQNVAPEGTKYRVTFAQGDDMASIALDASGRITGLFFEVPRLHATSFASAVDAFKSLPGRVSLLVSDGGSDRAALSPDSALAVGSSFKLAVLNAVFKRIAASKTTSWTSIVTLHQGAKSLPSGILQGWPDGAPLTLYTAAALMISQSDNTAADMMLRFAGRREVEAFGYRNRPFLSTREAFILKDPRNASLLARYRSADEMGRRALLPQVDALPLPGPEIFNAGPLDTDVEWFFTARELCGLMRSVQDLPLMSINPGLADPADWQRVAYKGGSEPGVLNLTTWLVARGGRSYCVSASWNDDKALDETRFYGLYKSLLSALAH